MNRSPVRGPKQGRGHPMKTSSDILDANVGGYRFLKNSDFRGRDSEIYVFPEKYGSDNAENS